MTCDAGFQMLNDDVIVTSVQEESHLVDDETNEGQQQQPASRYPFSVNPISYRGLRSPVVKLSDHGRHVMSSSPVPLKTRLVGQRCTLNLSRAETSSYWCGVVVRRGDASSGVIHVT
ncbi:uncharacterized protein TNCV_2116341 [Trichonephila clavipes]|nr:uncharacterized protein TNCV_2116341 [Trichonephila clavipes]